jgi:hypothetical protein
MAGILSFDQYLGGPDQIKVESIFPSNQKTVIYDYGQNITDWTFSLDHQTLIVDQMAFNRNTGQPNFSTSQVIGYFPKQEIPASIVVDNVTTGKVRVTFPAQMYTGAIIPDARLNVPITVVAITWGDNQVPSQINTHRWALVQCWEPDVTPGDPTDSVGYTAIGV